MLKAKWKESIFQYEGQVFLTQYTFLGSHHTEWSPRKHKKRRPGSHNIHTPVQHTKIKPPQGTGLPEGCPREHQVLLPLGPTHSPSSTGSLSVLMASHRRWVTQEEKALAGELQARASYLAVPVTQQTEIHLNCACLLSSSLRVQ